jgi:uncharacterized membrane protein
MAGMRRMSQTRVRAWLAVVIWALAGAGFTIAFFAWGGPSEYADDRARIVAGAVAIAFGYAGYLTAMWATRARGGAVLTDERDAQVVAQASRATLIVVLVAVFALSVGLWEGYREAGSVPVGWLWFLAYGVVIMTFVVHGVATLVVDGRLGGNGRG